MITVERVLFLRHVPLFAQMTAAELSSLARISEEAVFTAGSQIIVEGDLGDTLYLVVDGEVLIHSGEQRLGVLESKDHFGEMAILDGEPRSASATALTDCLVLTVKRRDFNDLLNQHVAVARAVITTLNERLRNTIGLLKEGKG
jgi:CRP-like cAMP-binding protein